MMHSKVEPENEILLLQTFSIKEILKVNWRVMHVLVIVCVCGFGLSVLSLRDLNIVLGPVRRIHRIAAMLHRQVCGTSRWQDTITGILPVVVLFILVDNDDLGQGVGIPVEASIILRLKERTREFHGVAGPVARPGIAGGDGCVLDELDGIGRSEDIKVGFEVKNVVVHRSGEVIVDLVAILLVVGVKGRLNISRSSDLYRHTSIQEKCVREHAVDVCQNQILRSLVTIEAEEERHHRTESVRFVTVSENVERILVYSLIIISHSRHRAYHEIGIFSSTYVLRVAVALYGEVGVVLEKTNAVDVRVGRLRYIE